MTESDRFARCLGIVLQWEGGFVNNDADHGGPTNLGVTQAALSQWMGQPCSVDLVRALTPAEVGPLYHANYWLAAGCDLLTPGLDLMAFDCAVNQGPRIAIRFCQLQAGLDDDGILGSLTRAAFPNLTSAAIQGVSTAREQRYRANPQFATFGKGWLRRLAGVTAQAEHMAQGA